jgi:hypothetical protein
MGSKEKYIKDKKTVCSNAGELEGYEDPFLLVL